MPTPGGDADDAARSRVEFRLRSQDQHRRDAYEPPRSKLNEGFETSAIRTVRGSGYMIVDDADSNPPRTIRGLAILVAFASGIITAVLGVTTLLLVHWELEKRSSTSG